MSVEKISVADAVAIHRAISSGATSVTLSNGDELEVKRKSPSGLRAVRLPDIECVEQNPNKDTKWARTAKSGVPVTWFIWCVEAVLVENKNLFLFNCESVKEKTLF